MIKSKQNRLGAQDEWEVRLQTAHIDFLKTLRSIDPAQAKRAPSDGKWSAVGHAQHLVMSLRPVWLMTLLPVWLHARIFGRSNRAARGYDEICETYWRKLGGRTAEAPPFVRPSLQSKVSVDMADARLRRMLSRYVRSMKRYSDSDLNKWLLSHPLLGKCTLREMAYFLAWHAAYHGQLVRRDYRIEPVRIEPVQ